MQRTLLTAVVLLSLALPTSLLAKAKSYQVTGPIIELTDEMIVVQKGKEKFEIDRNADTKVEGELKVGEKVTVFYTMTAAKVEAKPSEKSSDKSADKK